VADGPQDRKDREERQKREKALASKGELSQHGSERLHHQLIIAAALKYCYFYRQEEREGQRSCRHY